MSRAFVSEDAADASAAALPERPISSHPNLVTPRGIALLEDHVVRLKAALAAASSDDVGRPTLLRDLRYWQARRTSARLVDPPPATPTEVAFGTSVLVRRDDGKTSRYRIVGEDEADPSKGLLSLTAPLARALLGARIGDTVEVGGGRGTVTVEEIGGI
ncbi:MAG: GreA/GreB family elongation factor [Acetobacteraceae bacterium]